MAKKDKKEEKKEESTEQTSTVSSLDKVSMLLLYLEAISPDTTKQIYQKMGEEKSQIVLNQIANLGKVSKESIKPVINEAHTIFVQHESIIGGKNISQRLLKAAHGDIKTEETQTDEVIKEESGGFKFLENVKEEKLISFFNDNSISMAAFIFSLLSEKKAATILQLLEQSKSQEILAKSLLIKVNNFPILSKLEKALENKFTKKDTGIQIKQDKQIEHLTHILEIVSEEQRKSILEDMKKDNKEIAEKIEQKIFTFADLSGCSDEDVALIVMDIKNIKSLAFALKKCEEDLSKKLNGGLSERQKEILAEEEKTMPENIKPKDIAAAHSEILGIAKKLAKEEKISPLVKEVKQKKE